MLVKIFFEQVLIVKPISSKPANSETYLVCIGYKKKPSAFQQRTLINYMNYIKKLNNKNGCPSLFTNIIPSELLTEITKISIELSERQIIHIKNNLEYYNTYKDINISKIWNKFLIFHNKSINKWFSENSVIYLEDQCKMIYKNKLIQ